MMKLHARDRRTTGWSQQNWWHSMKERIQHWLFVFFFGHWKKLKRLAFLGGPVVKSKITTKHGWLSRVSESCTRFAWARNGTSGSWNKTNTRKNMDNSFELLNPVQAWTLRELLMRNLWWSSYFFMHSLDFEDQFCRVALKSKFAKWDSLKALRCIKLAFPCACWHFFLSSSSFEGWWNLRKGSIHWNVGPAFTALLDDYDDCFLFSEIHLVCCSSFDGASSFSSHHWVLHGNLCWVQVIAFHNSITVCLTRITLSWLSSVRLWLRANLEGTS